MSGRHDGMTLSDTILALDMGSSYVTATEGWLESCVALT